MHHRKHMSRDHYPDSPVAQTARTYSKHMSRDRYLLLCDDTADTENKASSIAACWTLFTELLPDNALMKSVKFVCMFVCTNVCIVCMYERKYIGLSRCICGRTSGWNV
jgi:hypothetical protein